MGCGPPTKHEKNRRGGRLARPGNPHRLESPCYRSETFQEQYSKETNMFMTISGTFHALGSPSGHAIHFRARDPELWGKLAGFPVTLNPQGQARVRLEGIDTLELDFQGRHQPLKYAREALDFLLSRLGIRGNLFGPAHARDGAAGYIVAGRTDRQGRPLALVFRGDPEGQELDPDIALLSRSINYQLLQAGLAYPAFDPGLAPRIRKELTLVCRSARNSQKGFWPQDRTNLGVVIDGGLSQLGKYIIFPRLFRHLVRFLQESDNLRGFKPYLEGHPDPVLYLPTDRSTDLGALMEVQNNSLKLTAAPEDLVFAEIW